MQLAVMTRRVIQFLILASVPALLFVVNMMLSQEFAKVQSLAEEVERAQLTRESLKTILSHHQGIESGQRGYVLTADPAFLAPYSSGQARIAGEFARLEMLLTGDAPAGREIEPLRRLSQQKRAFSSEVIRLTREGREGEAGRLVASGRGKSIMDELRLRISSLERHIEERLNGNRERHAAARLRTQRVAFAVQALLVVMLAFASWMIARALRAERRIAREFKKLSARQEAIFDSATDGLIIHDADGVIEAANPAMALMYGYSGPDELAGRHVDILFERPPPRPALREFLARLAMDPRTAKSGAREYTACRKDGTSFPVDVVTSPVDLAGGTVFLAAIRDASERKRTEQLKNEFVSTVSHELRTPLTSIAGSLGLLGGGAAGSLPEKAARLITIAHSNSTRLVRLINDILDIEKIESGKMTFNLAWLRLGPLLEQAVQANRGYAVERNVDLELAPVGDTIGVVGDSDRLMQVMANLISNAAKFSPAGGKVRIWVTPQADRHRITVADAGPGIPEEFRARIFTKFAQADGSDTRARGGTGLGLSIVREIVTRLGGAVSFDSKPGEGTQFHVDLPAAREIEDDADAEADSASPAEGEDGALPRILHVEDDADMLRLVASAFEGVAMIHSTPSVREGHAALRRQRFDGAILDVDLSDGSGLDLLPLLRDGAHVTPVVLFTVHDADPIYASRVDAVLTKSRATLDDLVNSVLSLVRRRKA